MIDMDQKNFNSVTINGTQYISDDVVLLIGDKAFSKRPEWEQKIFLFLQSWWNVSDYIEQKTSGSTGSAKIIKLRKKSMFSSAWRTCQFFRLSEASRAVLCLSTDYIAGKMMVVRAIASGLDLVTVSPEGNPCNELEGRVDFIAMVPLQAENMFSRVASGEICANIKTVLLGGAQVSSALESKIRNQQNIDFYIGYGMTETCSHVALRILGGKDEHYASMKGVKITLDDRGCVVIDDPGVAEESLITNDIAELDPGDPNRFKWLGRYDNVINSGGIKFSPEELEKKVSHLIDKPFIFSSLADERLGQKLVLIIEVDSAETVFLMAARKKQLIDSLRECLPKFAVPKELLFVPELAKTANGKVNRLATYSVE